MSQGSVLGLILYLYTCAIPQDNNKIDIFADDTAWMAVGNNKIIKLNEIKSVHVDFTN